MYAVTRHTDFGPVENGRLVHIIPDVDISGAIDPRELLAVGRDSLEESLPPVPADRVEEVHPRAATTPAPALEFSFPVLLFDQDVEIASLFVHWVRRDPFEMGIDNNNHLSGAQ